MTAISRLAMRCALPCNRGGWPTRAMGTLWSKWGQLSVVKLIFFFSSRRRHTRLQGDWSSDVCSSDLPQTSGVVYEFGPFRLEVVERRLLRDGHPVELRAKVFDTLRVLVENHGHLVGKIGRASCRERV